MILYKKEFAMKKCIALFLALILVFSLVACADNTKKTDKNKDKDKEKQEEKDDGDRAPTEEEMKVKLSDEPLELPEDAKSIVGGGTFTIFAPTPYGIPRFVVDGTNGTPVNDAIYYRNLKLQDELGVEIKAVDFSYYTHNQSEKIIDSVLNGDHSFDCAAIHSTSACAALIIANAVMNFDLLEYCCLDKPWWDQHFQVSCALNGQNYFGVNSSCYAYYSTASCILFNKTLAKEKGLEDIYDLVRNKKWTIDKLISMTKNYSEDLNSDGIFDNNDKLAIAANDNNHMTFFLGGFRQATVIKGDNEEPIYNVNTPRMAKIIEKMNELFHTGRRGVLFSMMDPHDYEVAFAEGRVLFEVATVGVATSMRDYDIDFGIVPLPLLDEEQKRYGAWVDPWHLTLCVPIDAENPERTSIILEAMAYHSYHYVYPAIVEQSIFGTGTRDVDSLEMLTDYIYSNVFYDFGYIYDGYGKGYSSILHELISEGSTDMASFIQTRRPVAENHYSELYDAYMSEF